MATEREFKLISRFEDGISKNLKKINGEVTKLSKSFDQFNKRLKPVTKGMNKFADATMRANKAFSVQREGFEEATNASRQYTTQMRKAYSAAHRMSKVKPPKPMSPPRMPTLMGGAPGGGGGGSGMAAGVAGGVAGMQLGNMLSAAILRGFSMVFRILQAPFNFIQRGLAERIGDEMSDVRAAGGLFSIAKRMDNPFVKNFAEAEALTKDTNRYLAELAGALPGDTQEYIQISKQISDGIYTVISNDKDNAIKLATEFAKERGADTAALEKGGSEAMRAAGKELVGEMTKLTVLAGLGGNQGAFGLPQLTEQMIARDEVTLGQFQRYAAIFRDPMIKGALERNIEKINASGKNTADRLKALRETFQEIVTPELVRRYQRTTEGVIESLKSTFLNPEVGLLGLGRPLNIMSTKFDEFGRAVMKDGKVVTEAIGLFDYFRDIFANLMIVMEPVLQVVAKLFDPFEKLGLSLDKIRTATMKFQMNFEQFTQFFKDQGDKFDAASIPLRGSLSALVVAFKNLGVIGKEEALKLINIIKDPKAGFKEFGAMVQQMLDKFLNSDGARKIGEAIGNIIGTIVATVGNFMSGATDLASAGPLAKGFTEGFEAAGGKEGFAKTIRGVFTMIGKAIVEVIKAAPLESAIIAGVIMLPSVIAAAVGGLVTKVVGSLSSIASKAKLPGKTPVYGPQQAPLATRAARQTTNAFKAMPGVAQGSKAAKALATGAKMKGLGLLAAGAVTLATKAPQLAKVGKALSIVGKRIPLLNVAFAGLAFTAEKAAGASTAEAGGAAAGGLAGGVIGGAIGTAILPGVGTAIGAVLGSFIGEWLGRKLPAFFASIPGLLAAGWENVKKFFESIPGLLAAGWENVKKFFESIPGLLAAGWENVKSFFTETIPKFFLQDLPYWIGYTLGMSIRLMLDAFKALWNFFTDTLPSTIMSVTTTAVQLIGDAFVALWTFFTQTLPNLISRAFSAFINWVETLPDTIGKAFTSFIDYAKTLPSKIEYSLMQTGQAILDWAKNLPNSVGNFLKSGIRGFQEGLGGNNTPAPTSTTSFGGNIKPLMDEMRYKPVGSNLTYANTSETILNTGQTALLANALQGGGGRTVNNYNTFNIDGSGDPDSVAEAILNAMRQMEQSTIS